MRELMQPVDWACVGAFFLISLVVGIAVTRKAGSSAAEFFAAGRNMPWWLVGVSMVATTFSTDTPNAVTQFVREDGVAGNWRWWAFLVTGMLTVFIYARLWKRSGVLTDLEFYELRYSGKPAAFLRGFRALYLGVLFNVIIMATVSLAAIKIGGVLLNLSPVQTILIASIVTAVYSSLGGLRGVLITDLIQFTVAMAGSVAAAWIALSHPAVGGLSGLMAHEAVVGKLSILPPMDNRDMVITLLVIPLAVQWWSVWYPGSEPGGGGYVAQRMIAAKSERHAVGAVLFFQAAHYALRPWPWIIVALASLIVFPDLASISAAFPDAAKVGNDMAYPAMLSFLPTGLLGIVVASLIAAYMSTISTHLNWGSSYIVHDFYSRFVKPEASERDQVMVGRISTFVLMFLAGVLALGMKDAMDNFNILLQIGAGTGLLFILRWFWWRINAFSEITAMVVSFVLALYFRFIHTAIGFEALGDSTELVLGVGITTVSWILVTFLTRPTHPDTLEQFYRLTRPGGPGWRPVVARANASPSQTPLDLAWQVPRGILCVVLGCIMIYGTLFATGSFIYGNLLTGSLLGMLSVGAAALLYVLWRSLFEEPDSLN